MRILLVLLSLMTATTLAQSNSHFADDAPATSRPRPQPPAQRPPQQRPPATQPPPRPVEQQPPVAPPDNQTDAGLRLPCIFCTQLERNIRDLQAVVAGQTRVGDLSSWRRSQRGFIQIPTEGPDDTVGPCGSTHYLPYSPGKDQIGKPIDNYADPTTACAFMSSLQEWKKNHCKPADAGCKIMWGDISHPNNLRLPPHSTGGHGHGNCIDIRPLRTGNRAINAGLNFNSADYDRTATRLMVEVFRRNGADTILFNDPEINTSRAGGHSNHLHVCFKPGPRTREACRNFRYDANVCEGG